LKAGRNIWGDCDLNNIFLGTEQVKRTVVRGGSELLLHVDLTFHICVVREVLFLIREGKVREF